MPTPSDPTPGAPYVKPWIPDTKGALPPAPRSPAALSTAPQIEVIIQQGATGAFFVIGGDGGTLTRTQLISFYGGGNNPLQVAKLRGTRAQAKDMEEVNVVTNLAPVYYDALACGETFFQATSPDGGKKSLLVRLLSLANQAIRGSLPPGDYSPAKDLKGLVTKDGTPLDPLPGRKINIFGEGESPDFEDYSSDIDFCSHTFCFSNGPPGVQYGHRPWTADPRRPSPGIPDKSVTNICCRSSPIHPVTTNEILRIGASKCRVTYAEGNPKAEYCKKLRAGLPGAKLIAEGEVIKGGWAVVLELP